jgi:hypothetical protein
MVDYFLFVAIAAEAVDANVKMRSAREQASRFEKLAHPLGDLFFMPVFRLPIKTGSPYWTRLEKEGFSQKDSYSFLADGRAFPRFNDEESELCGLQTDIDVNLVFMKKPLTEAEFKQWLQLSDDPGVTAFSETFRGIRGGYLEQNERGAFYIIRQQGLEFDYGELKSEGSGRYTDWDFTSLHDLPNKQLIAWLTLGGCPNRPTENNPESESPILGENVGRLDPPELILDSLDMRPPGVTTIRLGAGSNLPFSVWKIGLNSFYSVTFPNNFASLKRTMKP